MNRLHFVWIFLLFIGCNPAKRLLKQKSFEDQLKESYLNDRKAIAAEAVANYVRDHPCVFPEINLDSLLAIYCGQSNNDFEAAPGSVEKTVNDSAKVAIPKSTPAGKKILVPWEDKRRIELLNDSCTAKDIRLAKLAGQLLQEQANRSDAIAAGRKNIMTWLWILVAIAAFELLIILILLKK